MLKVHKCIVVESVMEDKATILHVNSPKLGKIFLESCAEFRRHDRT